MNRMLNCTVEITSDNSSIKNQALKHQIIKKEKRNEKSSDFTGDCTKYSTYSLCRVSQVERTSSSGDFSLICGLCVYILPGNV